MFSQATETQEKINKWIEAHRESYVSCSIATANVGKVLTAGAIYPPEYELRANLRNNPFVLALEQNKTLTFPQNFSRIIVDDDIALEDISSALYPSGRFVGRATKRNSQKSKLENQANVILKKHKQNPEEAYLITLPNGRNYTVTKAKTNSHLIVNGIPQLRLGYPSTYFSEIETIVQSGEKKAQTILKELKEKDENLEKIGQNLNVHFAELKEIEIKLKKINENSEKKKKLEDNELKEQAELEKRKIVLENEIKQINQEEVLLKSIEISDGSVSRRDLKICTVQIALDENTSSDNRIDAQLSKIWNTYTELTPEDDHQALYDRLRSQRENEFFNSSAALSARINDIKINDVVVVHGNPRKIISEPDKKTKEGSVRLLYPFENDGNFFALELNRQDTMVLGSEKILSTFVDAAKARGIQIYFYEQMTKEQLDFFRSQDKKSTQAPKLTPKTEDKKETQEPESSKSEQTHAQKPEEQVQLLQQSSNHDAMPSEASQTEENQESTPETTSSKNPRTSRAEVGFERDNGKIDDVERSESGKNPENDAENEASSQESTSSSSDVEEKSLQYAVDRLVTILQINVEEPRESTTPNSQHPKKLSEIIREFKKNNNAIELLRELDDFIERNRPSKYSYLWPGNWISNYNKTKELDFLERFTKSLHFTYVDNKILKLGKLKKTMSVKEIEKLNKISDLDLLKIRCDAFIDSSDHTKKIRKVFSETQPVLSVQMLRDNASMLSKKSKRTENDEIPAWKRLSKSLSEEERRSAWKRYYLFDLECKKENKSVKNATQNAEIETAMEDARTWASRSLKKTNLDEID